MAIKESTVRKQFNITEYVLVQIFPANGACAVHVAECPDGSCELRADELQFLGLARRVISRYVDIDGGVPQKLGSHDDGVDIVAVEIMDGEHCISTDNENFAGIMMPGQDIGRCTAYLRSHYRERLKPKPFMLDVLPAEQPKE